MKLISTGACLQSFTVAVTGNCLPIFGKKAGEKCYKDSDCETGYVCYDSMCSAPAPGVGQFGESSSGKNILQNSAHIITLVMIAGEECGDSSDCNIHLGLCCRLTRRQRMQPKKLCTYFTDADVCIGNVASHQVQQCSKLSVSASNLKHDKLK